MRQRIVAFLWPFWTALTIVALCLPATAAELPKYQVLKICQLSAQFGPPHGWGSYGTQGVYSINNVGEVTGPCTFDEAWHAIIYSGGMTRDLGTLGGSGESWGADINGAGQVAGGSAYENVRAFIYSGGAMTDLGTLGGSGSEATAINDAGQVTGVADTATEQQHAFRATLGQPMQDLGTLGGDWSFPSDINAAGQVTGGSRTASGPLHAFRAAPGQPMEDLGTLGGRWSRGDAINDAGQVTGISAGADGQDHAFRASPGQPMEDLGTLGGARSWGYAINGSGQVAGSSQTAAGAWHAFRATPGQPMQDLGTLGGPSSYAADINAAGQVIGFSDAITPRGLEGHAFLYSNGVMVDIGKMAIDGGTLAHDINDAGQVVGLYVKRYTPPPDEWFEGEVVLWTPISLLFSRLLDDVTGVGPGKSLAQKVRIATAYYDANDGPATCSMLRAFGNEVKAQSGKKKLSRNLAQQLMNDAQAIRVAIGCKGG